MFPVIAKKSLVVLLAFLFLATDALWGILPAQLERTYDMSNVVDKVFLARQNANVVDNFKPLGMYARAASDPNQSEYFMDMGPVNGSASANYVFASFFNPSGSGKTAVIKHITIAVNAVGSAAYPTVTLRRSTAASGGTLISVADIPKKNASSSNSVMELRHTGVTATLDGNLPSRIMSVIGAAAAGASYGYQDVAFASSSEDLIVQQGQGVALFQESAGSTNQRMRVYLEWEETASVPSAQSEYIVTSPRIEVAATAGYHYASFFNPATSGKTAVIKRIRFGSETCDTAAVYTNNISLHRISAASGGSFSSPGYHPKKNTSSPDSVMELRTNNPTVTQVGTVDARLGLVTPCAVAGQGHGYAEYVFADDEEKLILQPGEGISMDSETAGDVDQLNRISFEWKEVSVADTPAPQNEYLLAYPRVSDESIAPGANTVFYALFNPAGSGKTAVVKRLGIRINSDAAANYSAFTWRRISALSGGTTIAAANIPKKHASSSDTGMSVVYCGTTCATAVTATFVGGMNARILSVNGTGAVAQLHGIREEIFDPAEKLVLKEGEGIALYIEATGDIDHYVKAYVDWGEEASAPSSQGEYAMNIGPVNGSTATSYNYISFFNPAASGKTAVVKTLDLAMDAASTAVYRNIHIRRITAASGGTLIAASDIPKKNSSSTDAVVAIRVSGATVTAVGGSDASFVSGISPGTVGAAAAPQLSGWKKLAFARDEQIVLQPGEGIVLDHAGGSGDVDWRMKLYLEWAEQASTPSSQGEFLFSMNPATGSGLANYVYASFLNPSSSNKDYVVKRLGLRVNRATATTTPIYFRVAMTRITAASGGTLISTTDILKKNTGTATSTAEIRTAGVSVGYAVATSSRVLGVTIPGVVGQISGIKELEIQFGDELFLQPGEGVAVYQEDPSATADGVNLRYTLSSEWNETDVPSSSITLSLSSSTVSLGNFSPGAPAAATTTATVSVTGAPNGYTLQVARDSSTSTLALGADAFPDYDPAWNAAGNGNATINPGTTLAFRVRMANTTSNYDSAWWGVSDTWGDAKYAGFATTSVMIMNCATCASGSTDTVVQYYADAPANQPVGTYSGQITYTALTNP